MMCLSFTRRSKAQGVLEKKVSITACGEIVEDLTKDKNEGVNNHIVGSSTHAKRFCTLIDFQPILNEKFQRQ